MNFSFGAGAEASKNSASLYVLQPPNSVPSDPEIAASAADLLKEVGSFANVKSVLSVANTDRVVLAYPISPPSGSGSTTCPESLPWVVVGASPSLLSHGRVFV